MRLLQTVFASEAGLTEARTSLVSIAAAVLLCLPASRALATDTESRAADPVAKAAQAPPDAALQSSFNSKSDLEKDAAAQQYTCGQASLFAVARLKDIPLRWPDVARTLPARIDGTNSIAEVESAATAAGLHPIAVQIDRQQLLRMNPPAILHLSIEPHLKEVTLTPARHFAVAAWWDSNGVVIVDPPHSPRFLPWKNVEANWTGSAVLFADTPSDVERLKAELSTGFIKRYLPYALGGLSLLILLTVAVVMLWRGDRPESESTPAAARVGSLAQILVAAVREPVRFARSNLRLSLTALGLLLILAGGATASSWIRWAREPRLQSPTEVLEQGYLEQGPHHVVVMLTNTGGATLHLKKYESSCACAVPAGPKVIGPGESKPLDVVLNGSPGSRYADVFIYSDDPQGQRQLTFHWNGAATPWLLEKSLLREVCRGQTFQDTLTIAFPGEITDESPKFDHFHCDYPGLKLEPVGSSRLVSATLAQTGAPATIGYRDLRLTVAPPANRDEDELVTQCDVFLKDSHHKQQLSFRLRLLYSGRFGPQPDRVTFSAASAAGIVGQQRIVALAGCDSPPRIESCPDWLHCEVVRHTAGASELKTIVKSAPKSRFESGSVILIDAHGSKMELRASTIAAN